MNSGGDREKNRQTIIVFGIACLPIVIWLALAVTPYLSSGFAGIVRGLYASMKSPFSVKITEDSLKTVLIFAAVYAFAIYFWVSDLKNYRRGVEHGSAEWGNVRGLNKKYAAKEYSENKLFTENFRMSIDAQAHGKNLNTVVIGGSGAGKTYRYVVENLMQCNTSFVVTDPKGEIVRNVGQCLEKNGYEVRVLDLINMEKSFGYNPFRYVQTDNDAQRLATNLFKGTAVKGAVSGDQFWDTAAEALLLALILYLHHEAPEKEQNFSMVMRLLRAAMIADEDYPDDTPLNKLFDEVKTKNPDHPALKFWDSYASGAARTRMSIQATLAARMTKFNLEELESLTNVDELDLPSLGGRKVALFAVIPDDDTSFNFLVSIMYTQLFQQLFREADANGGALDVPVHFVMDEFANVALPDDFAKILSVMRSRKISVSIILQNSSQLKALFEKEWESIMGNCDEFLFLGGNEYSTFEYVSKLLGTATIDTDSHGKSSGSHGNYSTNYSNAGRELLKPDEVAALDNELCILRVRGEKPIIDKKMNAHKHPRVKETVYGGQPPYDYAEPEGANALAVALLIKNEKTGSGKQPQGAGRVMLVTGRQLETFYEIE